MRIGPIPLEVDCLIRAALRPHGFAIVDVWYLRSGLARVIEAETLVRKLIISLSDNGAAKVELLKIATSKEQPVITVFIPSSFAIHELVLKRKEVLNPG